MFPLLITVILEDTCRRIALTLEMEAVHWRQMQKTFMVSAVLIVFHLINID